MPRQASDSTPQEKRPILADIAEVAGVSIATVSKVLRGKQEIAQSTREQIERLAQEMGYVLPQKAPTPIKKRRRNSLLFVIGYLSEYEVEIQRGVLKALTNSNVMLHLVMTYDRPEQVQRWLAYIRGGNTDGVLLLGPQHLDEVRAMQFPAVLIDNVGNADTLTPSVGATNLMGGRTATSYLLSLGHRRIGMITGSSIPNVVSQERLLGYRVAHEEMGLSVDPALIRQGAFTVSSGYTETCALLRLPEPPTAIFTGNDSQAIGAYQALHEHNITIPDQMSIVGFDDLPIVSHLMPPLTTVRHPLTEMGHTAANMLLRLIAGEPLDVTHVHLSTLLIKRGSCAAPPPHVPEVQGS